MRLLPLAPLALLLLPAACDMGGQAKAQTGPAGGARVFTVGEFQRVALRGPDDAVVRVGRNYAVRAVGDKGVLSHLRVEVVGGELRIGRDQGVLGWNAARGKATIFVSVPRLRAVALSGAGDMKVDTIRQPRFEGAVSGSGDLDIGALTADEAGFTVTGAGDIEIATGSARHAALTLSGSGEISAEGLDADTLTISAVGSGDISARAHTAARISIIGSGDVRVKGKAKCTISRLGSGDATCGD